MDHYQDIQVIADAETSGPVLLAQLFMRLHQMLGRVAAGRIGVSFPLVARTLGDCLRVHGTLADLTALQQSGWQQGLRDYIISGEISAVPQEVSWRVVKRVQVKSSAERLRRRSVNKGWISEEEARERISVLKEQRSNLPYVLIKSGSNGNAYPLFIEHGPLQSTPVSGGFNSYGLSATATIPWF
ncbi:type I-F CRISPR-associated endoribonuclease Cas6/Csy4 [Erwinia sorbitola]|uniref:Type I-F CRISPR-associated endoribonuclease Cas6/Csy4 n=1 Tax=Erwinia sorbitola TaxID=2681984 RepID=A0A6I6EUV0_9GAMM|nr:type I-F CRISPR-associated endoribonuclease Cas6/Csy4 [Erwinia sorbitola]QGU88879.1 type I-F CRISPR-associated endoribonuclease Cas6/Csy4 [Erwinia sorbitola]